ncbi:MAG: glycosyltransferase family 39 protein [Deltaproteobacteria bacterium]|nr:glycosyltransferase family 39 protein [Deltaproteobacteria bacterium]
MSESMDKIVSNDRRTEEDASERGLAFPEFSPLSTSIAVYIAFVAPFLFQLPMHEEVIHIRDTSSWGRALAYYCHPPLYALLGKGARTLLGDSYLSLYMLGAASAIITLFLLSRLLKEAGAGRYDAFALVFISIMPPFVHGSLLLEMEPVVLTPLILLSLLYYIKGRGTEETSVAFYLKAGFLAGLAMWAKYFFTPFLLVFSIFVYESSSGVGFKRAVRDSALILSSALFTFVPFYLAYAYFFIDGPNSFEFIAFNKTNEGAPLFASGEAFFAPFTKLLAMTFWLSPFFIALFATATLRVLRGWRRGGVENLILALITSIFFFYLLLHPYPFGELKYFYPVYPLSALLVFIVFRRDFVELPLKPALIVVPIAAVFLYATTGDPLYESLSRYRVQDYSGLASYISLYAALNAAVFVPVYMFFKKRAVVGGVQCALVALSISSFLSLFASQAAGQYQTRVQYGETGAAETIEFVKAAVPPWSAVVIPGDIMYYTGIEFKKTGGLPSVTNDLNGWDWIIERKINLARLDHAEIQKIDRVFEPVMELGSYRIYRKR